MPRVIDLEPWKDQIIRMYLEQNITLTKIVRYLQKEGVDIKSGHVIGSRLEKWGVVKGVPYSDPSIENRSSIITSSPIQTPRGKQPATTTTVDSTTHQQKKLKLYSQVDPSQKDPLLTSWTTADKPAPAHQPTAEWSSTQSRLIDYHEMRQKMLDAAQESSHMSKRLIDQYQYLSRSKYPDISTQQQLLKRLYHLQSVNQECRTTLASCGLERYIESEVLRLYHTTIEDTAYKKDSFPSNQADSSPVVDKEAPLIYDMSNLLVIPARRVLDKVDLVRLKDNLQHFLSIQTRLPCFDSRADYGEIDETTIRTTNKGRKIISVKDMHPCNLIHDNYFHAKVLVDSLKRSTSSNAFISNVERHWQILTCLISLTHGCTSEPALLLSTIDVVLDQLRTSLGVSPDSCWDLVDIEKFTVVRLATSKEEYTYRLLNNSNSTMNSQADVAGNVRAILAEVALMIRGCVFTGIRHTRVLPAFDKPTGHRYDDLLFWNRKCAACGRDVCPDVSTNKDSLRIGVRDRRVGDASVRRVVSKNRETLYDCPLNTRSELFQSWSVTDGAVFFYFAQFFHASCKVRRGKNTLV